MSLRPLLRERNAWLAADRLERWKNAATVLGLGGIVITGLVILAVGLGA